MVIQDVIVKGRNKLVNSWIGVNPSLILNRPSCLQQSFDSHGLAGKIKRTLDHIKAYAIDDVRNLVDYSGISGSEAYRDYIDLVSQLHHFDLNSLDSISTQLAFWINLYNAMTMDAVIQTEVQKSVTEGFFGVFSFFERAAYLINGHRFSLNDIEHGILRANHGFPYFIGPHYEHGDPRRKWVISSLDPRVHFALNCASNSCPPIRFYTPEQIDTQLTMASKNFVSQNILIDYDRKALSLSSIFRWYQDDFGGKRGVLSFLIDHLPNDGRKSWLQEMENSVLLHYQKYDWGINRV